MKKILLPAFIILTIFSCGKTKPEPAPKAVESRYEPDDPRYKLDQQFPHVIDIAKYFQTKSYSGDRLYYTSTQLKVPENVSQQIDGLEEEHITYHVLLRAEILARNDARFDDAVIQRIFNSTFWYNQFASKKGLYNEGRLNIYEKENIRRISAIINGEKTVSNWD